MLFIKVTNIKGFEFIQSMMHLRLYGKQYNLIQ